MATKAVEDFIAKWTKAELKERSAAQEHFLDLCKLLDHPSPAAADPKGEWYCFERGAKKADGSDGWADVWKRGFFGWEYKRKKKDLGAAYLQVNQYREDLENPPLLVVCDTDRFEIHTNFTATAKEVHSFDLDGLRDNENLTTLRCVFHDPEKLRPAKTAEAVTEEAASGIAGMARSLEERGVDPQAAAHFLMQVIFCLFAEDIGLLPKDLVTNLLESSRKKPDTFEKRLAPLFTAMKDGGYFGADEIQWFNGGLFTDDAVIALQPGELEMLHAAALLDWSTVEPSIFGTLFERSLDPEKRTQIGAHYTSPEDIAEILHPVIFAPIRDDWDHAKKEALKQIARFEKATTKATKDKARQGAIDAIGQFHDKLRSIRVLDPACGSGNFLYLALRGLKDIEGEMIGWAAQHDIGAFLPYVSPQQLFGLEINRYAQELAQVVVWIGHLQWAYQNGYGTHETPVLKAFENIRCSDAILGPEADSGSRVPWPEADFVVGNPPFLGGKSLRTYLGDEYVERLYETYDERVPREADLVCYWFSRALEQVESGATRRVGFVATNSIRAGANRSVLQDAIKTGGIFMAWADRPWVLDGASVRVSMVAFDDGSEKSRTLDGTAVDRINSDLTADLDFTSAKQLKENADIAFQGDTKGGPFEIDDQLAKEMLDLPNPLGKSNRDVIRPWANAMDVTRRSRGKWIIDFGTDRSQEQAALYEAPFEYAKKVVKPKRKASKTTRAEWWIHERRGPTCGRRFRVCRDLSSLHESLSIDYLCGCLQTSSRTLACT